MNLNKLVPLLVLAAGILLAAACGSGSTVRGAAAPALAGRAGAAAQPGTIPDVGAAPTTVAPVPVPLLPPLPTAAPVPEGPRVQRTARLTLQVPNGRFDASLDRVISLIDGAGGYISGSQAQADAGGRVRSGQMTFQVPAGRFDDVLTGLRGLGSAQDITIGGNDVSLQYVDLQARLRNAEAQRTAMLALLQQARSVNDIIQVQNQLGQITGQIEQLEGQIAYLDHSTTYATVSVTIREAAASARPDEWGLSTAIGQGLHHFVDTINALVVILGALGPYVIAGLGLALVIWRLRLRGRRRPDFS